MKLYTEQFSTKTEKVEIERFRGPILFANYAVVKTVSELAKVQIAWRREFIEESMPAASYVALGRKVYCYRYGKFPTSPTFEKQMKTPESTYTPVCPRGFEDCVYDPAYIKFNYPDWYNELYGDKTPEEATYECQEKMDQDPSGEYHCYDNEDK